MRVLVTGVAGLIGSWLAEVLCKEKDVEKVTGVDDLSGGVMENVSVCRSPKFTFEQIDITQYKKIEEIFAQTRPHVVVHAAACAREGASAFQPHKITLTNSFASSVIVELGIKYGMTKLVFFSSMAVSGDNKVPFTEEIPRKPVDIYGVSKAATEKSIEILSTVHNFQYVIIRPHNVIGPRVSLTDPYRNVVAIFVNRLMRREPIYIFGDGHIRAFSYIEDSLPAFVRTVTTDKANGQIVFVGGKEQITIEQLAEAVIEDFDPQFKPEIIHLEPRPLEVHSAWCSIEKSVKLLGYRETIGWREGIKRTVAWARVRGPQNWTVDSLPLKSDKMPRPWRELEGR